MKRMKVPDYKDKNVFGVPLIIHVQRFGQPLPVGLQQALQYLRSQCLDQVRNPGLSHMVRESTVHEVLWNSRLWTTWNKSMVKTKPKKLH